MRFDQILKRHFWIVIGSLLAISSLLTAIGITQLASLAIAPDATELAAPPAAKRTARVPSSDSMRNKSAEPILSRNPFDSITGPLNKQEDDDDDESPEITDPLLAPLCDGIKALVIIASSDPDWSFVALSGASDNKSALRRKGGEYNGRTVAFVGWDRVWFGSGRSLCQAELFKSSNPPPPPPPPPVEKQAPSPGGGVPPDISRGISRISANEFNIDRTVVDKILENQADLMRSARIVPEQENGKIVGIRLFGVKQDTLLGMLGMENGDRLQTINGFDMTSPEKALEAYARLRTADHLTVQVGRKGNALNLDYNIK